MTAKEYLEQYMALNAEIEQLEHELGKLASQPVRLETDCVLGSPDEEPYQNIPIPIRGYIQNEKVQEAQLRVINCYNQQLERLYQDREQAENIISKVDNARARTIIRYRYIEGMEWNDIAAKMGHIESEESIRKYATRYLQKVL